MNPGRQPLKGSPGPSIRPDRGLEKLARYEKWIRQHKTISGAAIAVCAAYWACRDREMVMSLPRPLRIALEHLETIVNEE